VTSKLLGGIAALAVASVGLAAPAHADAHQDQSFYRLLTDPDQDHPMVVWDWPGIRSQGIAVCQSEDAGRTPYQALKDLQYGAGYTFDDANSISSSAETIYCPWHTQNGLPNGGTTTSTPTYPPPIYAPLAWYPDSPSPAYNPLAVSDPSPEY
jgi:Protein of unknown function (DUF732)